MEKQINKFTKDFTGVTYIEDWIKVCDMVQTPEGHIKALQLTLISIPFGDTLTEEEKRLYVRYMYQDMISLERKHGIKVPRPEDKLYEMFKEGKVKMEDIPRVLTWWKYLQHP